MKKIVIVLALAYVTQGYAIPVSDQLIAFNNMKLRHKEEWIDFKEECMELKEELIKTHLEECVILGNSLVDKLVIPCSQGDYEDLLQEKLYDFIELYKKHKEEMKNLFQSEHEKARELMQKHDDELAIFESDIMGIVGEEEIEIGMEE